jgi:hypothetical protein
MCRAPVTLGGGIAMTNASPSAVGSGLKYPWLSHLPPMKFLTLKFQPPHSLVFVKCIEKGRKRVAIMKSLPAHNLEIENWNDDIWNNRILKPYQTVTVHQFIYSVRISWTVKLCSDL